MSEPCNYDKPFKTYQEQIHHLADKYGLIIKDTGFAEHALKTMSYYDLINGYQDSMMINGRYRPGITIEFLYRFHLFDKGFQNIIFPRIMLIENYFKSILSHCIAENFGVDERFYLDRSNYNYASRNIDCQHLLDDIKRIFTQQYPPMPTRFYKTSHNHIPPWILFKNISFGNSINLFRVLRPPQKNTIANTLLPTNALRKSAKIAFLISGLNLIRKCRNMIAHNLKFVTFHANRFDALQTTTLNTLLPPPLTKLDSQYPKLGNRDLYAAILFIHQILGTRFLRHLFLIDLINYLSSTSDRYNTSLFTQYSAITKLPPDLLRRCLQTMRLPR
jgi:hypothetical protein